MKLPPLSAWVASGFGVIFMVFSTGSQSDSKPRSDGSGKLPADHENPAATLPHSPASPAAAASSSRALSPTGETDPSRPRPGMPGIREIPKASGPIRQDHGKRLPDHGRGQNRAGAVAGSTDATIAMGVAVRFTQAEVDAMEAGVVEVMTAPAGP